LSADEDDVSLYATYPNGEPIHTRPPLDIPDRADGARLEWVQNIRLIEVMYWGARNELAAHVFRKSYAARWWDISHVIIGEPHPTTACTVEALIDRDILGVYAWWVRE
jgi:hypothetical protein